MSNSILVACGEIKSQQGSTLCLSLMNLVLYYIVDAFSIWGALDKLEKP